MAFTWPDPALALLHRLWRDRDKISVAEMAHRISLEFRCDVSPNGVAKKAAREGLPAGKTGRPRQKHTRSKTRSDVIWAVRQFIAEQMEAGAARAAIIDAALAQFDAPRHRVSLIWRQENEKRALKDLADDAPADLRHLQLAPGVFAADPKSYELIQRARAA